MPISIVRGMVSGPLAENFVERLALQELHGYESLAGVVFDGVDNADARMVERGGRAGLAEEALHRGSVAIGLVGQKLESHATAELGVLGFVDHAHAAAADFAENFVVGDRLAVH